METEVKVLPVMKCWHLITVRDQFHGGGKLVWWKKWEDLPVEVSIKWRWYFVYRAALMQVKYPCYQVEHRWGSEPAVPQDVSWKNGMKNRIKGAKANLTKAKNKLEAAVNEWDEIFPIEQDPLYPKAVSKIKRLENELKLLQDEYLDRTGEAT